MNIIELLLPQTGFHIIFYFLMACKYLLTIHCAQRTMSTICTSFSNCCCEQHCWQLFRILFFIWFWRPASTWKKDFWRAHHYWAHHTMCTISWSSLPVKAPSTSRNLGSSHGAEVRALSLYNTGSDKIYWWWQEGYLVIIVS